ncbi:MAG: PAS domain-containing protein, partial [Chitinophagaceae bacterium]
PFIATRSGKLVAVVSCFCFLFVCLIGAQIATQLAGDKRQTIDAAVQRNANLAVSLEQYAIRTIRNADAVIRLVAKEYEEKGNNIDFHTLFSKGIIDVNYFNGVAIVDSSGRITLSNLGKPHNFYDFSDRVYFQFHKQHKDSLHLSHPLVSRTIGKTVIVVSRRLNNPDGSFGGTIALQVEPSTFTQFYSNANLRPHDIISLISPQGITYARRTGKKESSGEDISKSPLFTHVAEKPVNNYFANDAIHGVPTYFSYRRLVNYPVIATVGSSEKDILADYYERAQREYVFGAILSALLILFSILICTFFIQRSRHMRTIRNNEARYRSIFENTLDAIILIKSDGKLEAMNDAAYNLFKINGIVDIISGSSLFLSSKPVFRFTPEELNDTKSAKTEIVFTRNDETEFVGEVMYSTYNSAEGNAKFIVLVRDITQRKLMEKRLLTEQKRYQRRLTKQIILAQEREREAIGHELHDNVNQILTTVKLFLEMARNNADMRDELLPKSIHYIQSCIHEIRNLSHELSSPTLGTRSLIDSVKALIEMVESSGKFKIYFHHESYRTALEKDQMLAIYRILQEQLNNIIKHADASEVHICLSQQDGQTQVVIRDNGKGFDYEEALGGIGFNNMRSRTKVFGGNMQIKSSPGEGCIITISIPHAVNEEVMAGK